MSVLQVELVEKQDSRLTAEPDDGGLDSNCGQKSIMLTYFRSLVSMLDVDAYLYFIALLAATRRSVSVVPRILYQGRRLFARNILSKASRGLSMDMLRQKSIV